MDAEQSDLTALWERARTGDEDASKALVEGLYPTVIRIVRCHLPVRLAEEELAQDVFVRIFSNLDRYRPRPDIPMTHWVSRVAVTTCLDALRAERRRPEVRWADLSDAQAGWLEYLTTDADQPPHSSGLDARELVQKLLSQLPPGDRLILNLLHLEERSVKDISRLTGWSVPGVKVRAFRARRRLRQVAQQFKSSTMYEEL